MDELISQEEIYLIRQAVRNFISKEVEPLGAQMEEEDHIPKELLEKAAEVGLFGLSTPQKYGGMGAGMIGKCLISEEIGRGPNCFATTIGCHNGIGTVGIVEFGSEEQKQRYLPKMAAGELIGAFSLTEASAGSDPSGLKTTAILKGDKYILNGTKLFVTNGAIADVFTVMAVTDKSKGTKGITSFIVGKNFPGFKIGKPEKKMGLHGNTTTELIFEDCEVPVENVLGELVQYSVNNYTNIQKYGILFIS